jgi:hypothetical protein
MNQVKGIPNSGSALVFTAKVEAFTFPYGWWFPIRLSQPAPIRGYREELFHAKPGDVAAFILPERRTLDRVWSNEGF